ncbi:Serine/threonine-protein kinase ATM [Carex littledalei]|uniref:Serine/threonine-protein kinase ATM n=1 Tax=Carex littledalei TaxID=544730 RepID=A0A833RJT4_9POAL|nr:Serine/threonine-protein kinase ATM [Carex littledalei]
MASVPPQEPPMPDPDNRDGCSTSPAKTLAANPEDPLEEPNLESNPEDAIENKTPKFRGRPKKKDDQKQPVSETKSKLKPETENGYDRPVYSSPFQDETRNVFVPSDLVWGKVKNHPWWPGLIFDPSDASELALKHRNKNKFLVAYLFDNTFAWNEASVLKPFQSNFRRMVKQSSTDSFVSAVDSALAEVSRRVQHALSCGCYNGKESSSVVKFENVGIQANTAGPSGDVLYIRRFFDPVKFLGYLCELGQNPHGGFSSLDLVVTKSQLTAFNQSRGCNFDLPEFCFSCPFEEETLVPVTADRIYTRKRKSIDGESSKISILKKDVPEEEGRKKKKLSEIFNKEISGRPLKSRKVCVGGPVEYDNLGKYKKKRLDLLGDLDTKLRARRKYLRVGQCMQRAVNEIARTTPTSKTNGMTSRKRKRLSMIKDRVQKPLQREKGKVSSDNLSRGKSGRKNKEVLQEREDDGGFFSLEDYASSSEMLSQLCLAALDPLKGYSFITMIDSFFTRFRGYVVNPLASKRNRRKSVSGKLEDEVLNTHLSDTVVDDRDDEKLIALRQKKQKSRKWGKEKIIKDNSVISGDNPGEDMGNEHKQEGSLEIADTNGHGLITEIEETIPTALVLKFKETIPLPTKLELNGLFTRFGPVKEAETEVSELERNAWVVFKRHADAEVAFTNAGKLDAFGADLVSFQLSCAPTSSNIESTGAEVELQGEKDAASPFKAAC